MNPILDRVAAGLRSDFRPANPLEFFALRLANRLREPQTARHLAMLASEHGEEKLLAAFQRTIAATKPGTDIGKRFHTELAASGRGGVHTSQLRLAAFRAERRSVGAAIFRGTQLESVRVRQVPSNPERARGSIIGFVVRLVADYNIESAVIENVEVDSEIQRAILTRAILEVLREDSISVWELSKRSVAEAFAFPPLTTRTELREVIQRIWPQLKPKRGQVCVLDAAAMGLFVQTERMFNNF